MALEDALTRVTLNEIRLNDFSDAIIKPKNIDVLNLSDPKDFGNDEINFITLSNPERV